MNTRMWRMEPGGDGVPTSAELGSGDLEVTSGVILSPECGTECERKNERCWFVKDVGVSQNAAISH